MRQIRKRALAESDLISIWLYTFEKWDTAQADTYLDELDRGIRQLASNPAIGAKRDAIREGYRVLFCKQPRDLHRHAERCSCYPRASCADGS